MAQQREELAQLEADWEAFQAARDESREEDEVYALEVCVHRLQALDFCGRDFRSVLHHHLDEPPTKNVLKFLSFQQKNFPVRLLVCFPTSRSQFEFFSPSSKVPSGEVPPPG